MQKIGILGGTFDPVHYGHIYLAEQAVSECGLDLLLVIPAKIQPFKVDQPVTGESKRFEMAKLAFEGINKVKVSDLEFKREGVSYTIHTLREVQKQFGPNANIYFIVGTDAFLKVEIWREAEALLREFAFIVGMRPGYKEGELTAFIEKLKNRHNTVIQVIQNRQVFISSTEIKEKIASGESCEAFFPPEVERYINENGLYRNIH